MNLQVDAVKIGEGRSVEFATPSSREIVRPSQDELRQLRPFTTDDGAYTVYVPLDKSHLFPVEQYRFVNYSFYVQNRASSKPDLTQFIVPATAEGDFADRWTQTTFKINDGKSHNGVVELPVHSASRTQDLISLNVQTAVIDLASGDYQLDVGVKNQLGGLRIAIEDATVVSVHHQYWSGQLQAPGSTQLRFASSGTSDPPVFLDGDDTATATLSTRLLHALAASFLVIDPDEAHENLDLKIRYSPEFGGLPRTKIERIKVRFVPPLWALLLSAIVGAVVSSFVTLLFPEIWQRKNLWQPVVSGALLAILAEILALLISKTNTKVMFLGVNLDPGQMLPALALGILVGLARFKVLEALKVPIPGGANVEKQA